MVGLRENCYLVYIKDANTLKNTALLQIVVRSTLKVLLFVLFYISEWFLILLILVLIFAALDKYKQFFHDKIANTLVIEYKPEEYYLNLSYVGVTRRVQHILLTILLLWEFL